MSDQSLAYFVVANGIAKKTWKLPVLFCLSELESVILGPKVKSAMRLTHLGLTD